MVDKTGPRHTDIELAALAPFDYFAFLVLEYFISGTRQRREIRNIGDLPVITYKVTGITGGISGPVFHIFRGVNDIAFLYFIPEITQKNLSLALKNDAYIFGDRVPMDR
jgi:hypothetical protein